MLAELADKAASALMKLDDEQLRRRIAALESELEAVAAGRFLQVHAPQFPYRPSLRQTNDDVRFGSEADIEASPCDVRFTPRKQTSLNAMGEYDMNIEAKFAGLEVGYDVPAIPGMSEDQIQTPCLILDLDALERNVRKMGDYARAHNMRHRAHGKMHKSIDVLRLQQELGGAIGVCCQKVSEAEVFARAGIKDVLVSNQVRDPTKIDRLARLPRYGARIVVCVDDLANIAELSTAAQKHGTTLECFVEIDCGVAVELLQFALHDLRSRLAAGEQAIGVCELLLAGHDLRDAVLASACARRRRRTAGSSSRSARRGAWNAAGRSPET